VPPSPTPVPPTATPPPQPSPTPRSIAVPQLRGRTLEQAQSALASAGLTVMVRGVNANVDRNVVADQTPAAGATLAPGGTVTIMVGTGSTAIPVTLRERRDNRVAAGAAIGTIPPAGTVLARGSDVELDISTRG
jgi:beta-lactam-binding protein with PASTA domain